MLNQKEYLNMYETIKDEIKFFVSSEARFNILRYLAEFPVAMKELYNKTNFSYSAITSNVSKLHSNNYLAKNKGKYKATDLTKIKLINLGHLNDSLYVINECSSFWENHDISAIPLKSLGNLRDLKGAHVIETSQTDIYKINNEIKNILESSKNIKCVFPFLHPDFPLTFEDLLREGCNIELFFVKEITMDFIKSMEFKIIKEAIQNKNLKIESLPSNMNILLIVTENTLALGLFKDDESFDQNRLLISKEKNSIKWGNKIFEKYAKKSTKFLL